MTTITYRDGIMASDSRAFAGDALPIGRKQKAFRLESGDLVGISTTVPGLGDSLIGWIVNDRCEPDRFPARFTEGKSWTILLVRSGGVFFCNDTAYLSGPLDAPYFAIGSGERYALGAMAMGASAERACEVGIDLDPWSDGPIQLLTVTND